MRKYFLLLIILNLLAFLAFAQKDTSNIDTPSKSPKVRERQQIPLNPVLGIGSGMFAFVGDIQEKTYSHPMVSRLGYELYLGKKLNPFLEINFGVLFGKLGANERSIDRNLNFQSEIRAGGVSLAYNFHHILKKDRLVEPVLSIGFNTFEFLSKTDLYDAQGNLYYYWSDGSIRNLAENDPYAATAKYLQRDYTYETDIRESNLDGYGKYAERSFAVPLGFHVRTHLSDRVDFKIGTTLYYTFTDYVDGVAKDGIPGRIGNPRNDMFLYTSASLTYDFMFRKDAEEKEEEFSDFDLLAEDIEDSDGDGVHDFIDKCANTPPGIKVDMNGCPIDEDNDGVPDYKDDELPTRSGVFVTMRGEELTDSIIQLEYDRYMDSTGVFAKIINTTETEDAKRVKLFADRRMFTVQLGEFTSGVPPELINKFLSIPDIATTTLDNNLTVYTAGNYPSQMQAEKRKDELIALGITNAKVVEFKDGKFSTPKASSTQTASTAYNTTKSNNELPKNSQNQTLTSNQGNTLTEKDNYQKTNNNEAKTNNNTSIQSTNNQNKQTAISNSEEFTSNDSKDVIVFRVQLGAYKSKISKNIFTDVNDLVVITTEEGLTKYLTGSFTNFNDAAKHKVNMLLKGYSGAFIVAYKNGKRVPLSEAGATIAPKEKNVDIDDTKAINTIDKSQIRFKVQIGAFKNEPPAEIKEKISAISNVEKQYTESGLTRYTVGSFTDYEKANLYKNELVNKYGINDAFIVAFFKEQLIPVQEAIELLK
ncbi:MAG: SPOR domain-containing protein [Bacteroidia bacterium]